MRQYFENLWYNVQIIDLDFYFCVRYLINVNINIALFYIVSLEDIVLFSFIIIKSLQFWLL